MEAIYILKRRRRCVRSVDVANYMGHTKPSITRSVSILKEKGYVTKIDNEIVFTESGAQAADQIVLRHCILTHALTQMGIDEATAVKDAQNIERIISDEAINRAAALLQCEKSVLGRCPILTQAIVGE